MELTTLALDLQSHSVRRRRRRRTLTIVALGVSFLASAAYWLGASGSTSTSISPTPGSSGGAVANVSSSTLNGNITRGGNLTVGVPISRIITAKSRLFNQTTGQNVRVSTAWINASTAVLNGNDIVSVGLWYPVSTSSGTCHSTGGPSGAGAIYVADSAVTGGASGVCVEPDTAATGGANVDTGSGDPQQGSLILSKAAIGGFLLPGTGLSTTISLCSSDLSTSHTWCQPPGVGDQSTDTNRTEYLLAQVVNHGGNVPPGQQPSPGDFKFFTRVKAVG